MISSWEVAGRVRYRLSLLVRSASSSSQNDIHVTSLLLPRSAHSRHFRRLHRSSVRNPSNSFDVAIFAKIHLITAIATMFTRQRTSFPSICVRSTRSLPLVAVPSLTSMRLLSHATGDGPRLQLERLRELMQKAAGTNSLLEKQAIIAGYPDLRRLLDM